MSDDLVISEVRVNRGDREVVHGISLTAAPGRITALLGPNGAGKSSLVLALAGVIKPTGGTMTLGGVELAGQRPSQVRAAGLATVPEGHRVLKDMSVEDNLWVASLILPRAERPAAVERVESLFSELVPLRERMAGSLSGGQQQMLAIGQALVGNPRFLVIDEMSLGLAPIVVRRLAPAVTQIAEDGVGVILIEQFTHIALEVATTAYALVHGEIVVDGVAAAELREHPERLEQAYKLG